MMNMQEEPFHFTPTVFQSAMGDPLQKNRRVKQVFGFVIDKATKCTRLIMRSAGASRRLSGCRPLEAYELLRGLPSSRYSAQAPQ